MIELNICDLGRMPMRTGLVFLGLVIASLAAPDAVAQYYPGYDPYYYYPRQYPPPYAPPYPPPGYYPPRVELGGRCNTWTPAAYGPSRLICDIIRPRPIGRPCVCPPPPSPPGYPPGPYLNGRVIP